MIVLIVAKGTNPYNGNLRFVGTPGYLYITLSLNTLHGVATMTIESFP